VKREIRGKALGRTGKKERVGLAGFPRWLEIKVSCLP